MPTSRVSPEMIERSFGLVATIENRRVVLPLKAVECEFSVAAGLVEVTRTQVFRQENPKPLDCDYLFPLPADASVYCCEADFNGRIIRAVVKERGEAVRLAEEKKAEGRRVALVESERENLFTLALKNLQPDDLVLVTLKYIQPLRHLADLPSVEIPLGPGIRYIPGNPLIRSNRGKGVADDTDQVPDASRISPVRLDKEHPDAAFVEIRGRLDGKFVEAAAIQSPSHNVISRPEGEVVTIRLSDKGEVPDRDFVLRWKENQADQLTTRAWLQAAGDDTYALLEIRVPKASGPAKPLDFYFLVDHSGSMEGIKWEKAALAVQTSVATLTAKDRVMLTLFSNGVRDFAEQPLPSATLLADVNFQMLEQNGPNGGTELGGALLHVLERAAIHSGTRQKTLILITDAQVGNDAGILKLMEYAPEFSVHCIGIDLALNDALLLALARQQQGTFHSLNPNDDVVKVVSSLAATIRHPVLRDLQLSAGWEPSVKSLPPLFSEQVFHLSARSHGQPPLSLQARNGDTHTAELPMTSQPSAGDAPGKHWCKNRIQTLMAAGDIAAAIELSVKSNLICPLTAFIAWDDSEKVAVASHSFAQPVMEGELCSMASCAPDANFMHSMSRSSPRISNRQAGSKAGAFEAHLQERGVCSAPPNRYDDPHDIIRAIVEHAGRTSGKSTPPPYNDAFERNRALNCLVLDIKNQTFLAGLSGLWIRIMDWAMENNHVNPQMLERTQKVAILVWELAAKAKQYEAASLEIMSRLMELNNKSRKSSDDFERLNRIYSCKPQTGQELMQIIEAEFHERVDEKLVTDYVQIPREIKRAIEDFAKQHLNP